MKTPTIPLLLHTLAHTFPALLQSLKAKAHAKPVKLLIIDAITELFHSGEKVSSATLAERSKNVTEIASLLHLLAHEHGLAVVVLNEVSDAIDRSPSVNAKPHEVRYQDQARLFNRADSISAEKSKEAALGLVWANQINARIMLTRTDRVRTLEDAVYRPSKRRRVEGATLPSVSVSLHPEAVRVRRLSVIINPFAPPTSLDYIIAQCGVVVLEGSEKSLYPDQPLASPERRPAGSATAHPLESMHPIVCPLDVGELANACSDVPSSTSSDRIDLQDVVEAPLEEVDFDNRPGGDEDEWESYWKSTDLGIDVYSQIELDLLSPDYDPGAG